jgi:hypothetical protein
MNCFGPAEPMTPWNPYIRPISYSNYQVIFNKYKTEFQRERMIESLKSIQLLNLQDYARDHETGSRCTNIENSNQYVIH